MPTYRIELLGHPRFSLDASASLPLPGRMALLLAYLALEGPTTKERLGVLFWPESTSCRLRNSMRQLLLKLRKTVGRLYEERTDTLWLAEGCQVDAHCVRDAFKHKEWARVVAASPHFLGDRVEDGSPELNDWVEFRRREFLRMHKEALAHEAVRQEEEGDHGFALELACQLLNLDPFSDDACRRVMRLQFQRGDRSAALQTYQELCEHLRRDGLGVEPEARTRSLAEEIRLSPLTPVPLLLPRPALPISVLRPPLVGRARQWEQLETAWQARIPIIYVCGRPGMGKSRLMTEFAQAKGAWFLCGARPGDAKLPYTSRSRTIRSLLKACPQTELEPWVIRELSRIVPELAEKEGSPLPLPTPYDKPPFLEANYRLYERVGRRLATAVYDDGQFIDPGTFEMGLYLEERCLPLISDGRFPPILVGLQPGELEPDEEAILRQRVEKGLAAWIEVGPLSPEDVRQMIAGMKVPGLEPIAGELAEHAGGVPGVVVETVKQLLTQDGWDGTFPRHLLLRRRG